MRQYPREQNRQSPCRKWRLRNGIFILFVCCLLSQPATASPTKEIRRVLFFHEVSPSFPGVGLIDREIDAALSESDYQIELYNESLEITLFPDDAHQRNFREWYIRKYQDRKPDLIIAEGASSIEFMVESHEKFFPNTPVVFCGSSQEQVDKLNLDSRFTGTWMTVDPEKTFRAALQLQPNTRHVVVVGGAGPWDRPIEALVRDSLRKYEPRFEFTYLTDLAMPTLLQRLSRLPNRTIIFYTSLTQDAEGTHFVDPTQALPRVVGVANAPVFAAADVFVGQGTVGGYATSYVMQGQVAGAIAVRILKGARPQDIPVVKGTSVYMFDWRALRRWGFREGALPPGSVVLNRPPWQLYRRYIIGAVFVFLAESLLILALLWQRARRRKVEDELLVTNDRLRSAMESGRAVGWEWNLKTGRDSWFGDLKTMFGTPPDPHVWRTEDFYGRVHPEDRQHVSETVANAKTNHKPYAAEFRVLRPDGALRWVAATGKFSYSPNGEPERMLGVAQDITDRKRAEETLRESEERLRLAVQAGKMYAFEWDIASDAIMRTGQCTDVLNWMADPTCDTGRQFVARVHPDDREAFAATVTGLSAENSIYQTSYRMLRPDGSVIWLEESGHAFFDGQGRMLRTIGIVSDVTGRRLAEEALSSVNRRLIEAQEKERIRIARELHDDICQRLALLTNGLEQLRQDSPDLPAEVQKRVGVLRDQASGVATDIQSLSHELHSSKLEHLGIVTAMRGFCRDLSAQQKLVVNFADYNIPSTVPQEVSLCLFRILQEALRNAVKHSGGRHFDVELCYASHAIHLTVSDSGSGFDVQEAMKTPGLGLTSMAERLKLVDGQLSVDSEPKHGTTVHACVPLSSGSHSLRAAG
jgi:signal transduction histidine kinase/ABC-type uncharacterized transport system substrate-binding protein